MRGSFFFGNFSVRRLLNELKCLQLYAATERIATLQAAVTAQDLPMRTRSSGLHAAYDFPRSIRPQEQSSTPLQDYCRAGTLLRLLLNVPRNSPHNQISAG